MQNTDLLSERHLTAMRVFAEAIENEPLNPVFKNAVLASLLNYASEKARNSDV